MRCTICDCEDSSVIFDPIRKVFTDCDTCSAVVAETVEEYDKEEVDEDDDFYVLDDEAEFTNEHWKLTHGD